MVSDSLENAIKEAYEVAPVNIVIFDTIEISHPDFLPPIRLVRDHEDRLFMLESGAPYDSLTRVTFNASSFDIILPSIDDSTFPQISVSLSNISRAAIGLVENVIRSTTPVLMIYRPYLSTDLDTPQYNPPLRFTLASISVSLQTLTATATFPNLANISFPRQTYNSTHFPRLFV